MKLFSLLKKFRADESGAVTVDWVVLTAAIVGLGIVVIETVGEGVTSLATEMSTAIADTEIGG